MRQSTRLILNTAATFARMLVTVGVSLLATRLLLRELGDVDYGVYGLVLAAATTLTFISESLTTSAMTRLTIEIGRKDEPRLRRVMGTSVWMFAAVGALMMLATLALGGPIIRVLEIPAGRAHAAWLALQLSMAGLACTILATPFRALITAHQNLVLLAAFDALEVVLRLVVVVLVAILGGDALVNFCALLTVGLLLHSMLLAGLAIRRFPEARPVHWVFSREQLGRLLSFGWWDVLLSSCWRTRVQGTQFVLNLTFGPVRGPVLNAAYSLAAQVGMLQNQLAAQIGRAAQPAIVHNEAAGDRASVHRLVLVTSKYVLLAMAPVLVPILLEPRLLLELWLGTPPPPMAETFLQFFAGWVFLFYSSIGHHLALQATRSIKGYALWMFGIDAAALVIGAVWMLRFGGAAWALPLCTLVATAISCVVRATYVGPLIGLPVSAWLRRTIVPVLVCCGPGLAGAWLVQSVMPPGAVRLGVVMVVFGVLAAPLAWLVALESWERAHFLRLLWHAMGVARAVLGRGRKDDEGPSSAPLG